MQLQKRKRHGKIPSVAFGEEEEERGEEEGGREEEEESVQSSTLNPFFPLVKLSRFK